MLKIIENERNGPISLMAWKRNFNIFRKKFKKNLQVKIFVVPLQSQNKQSGGGEMVDTLL